MRFFRYLAAGSRHWRVELYHGKKKNWIYKQPIDKYDQHQQG